MFFARKPETTFVSRIVHKYITTCYETPRTISFIDICILLDLACYELQLKDSPEIKMNYRPSGGHYVFDPQTIAALHPMKYRPTGLVQDIHSS